jgi:uncharacterized UPF0146 family protein
MSDLTPEAIQTLVKQTLIQAFRNDKEVQKAILEIQRHVDRNASIHEMARSAVLDKKVIEQIGMYVCYYRMHGNLYL